MTLKPVFPACCGSYWKAEFASLRKTGKGCRPAEPEFLRDKRGPPMNLAFAQASTDIDRLFQGKSLDLGCDLYSLRQRDHFHRFGSGSRQGTLT